MALIPAIPLSTSDAGLWSPTLKDQITKSRWRDWAHVLINGTGILNNWKWPDIEGFEEFAGPKIHSAAWDHSVEFEGKLFVYAVVDLDLSGQVLESELKKGDGTEAPGNRQYTFTGADKKGFREDPGSHLEFRKEIEADINIITEEMNRRMGPGNEKLKEFIIPKWSPGCRRISPGDGYLEALVQPNVEPVYGGIKQAVPGGLVSDDGMFHNMDVLACATDFNGAFKPAFKVVNGDGKTVQEDWGDSVNFHFDTFHRTTVFQEECRSWFKDGKIKNRVYLWPGPTVHFLKSIKDSRFEDYDIRWRYGNRFAYLGNGEVKASKMNDVHGLSPYVRSSDYDWDVE
ncbi:Flavin-binding monooxygenase-like [Geosmithia morbida]|uniref:Flavin-binding monooxygenase-like n=1 Tax=Geosmithia morbida TaxID=1094350 RepID=A0A9P4YPD5_9HYPO|nr:Flavin-binding monooxygenase-like [Geosmithia morbida]KAF4120117.1 Flavin-binding monooxygenase-like [Geosmithia morbida]